MTEAPPVPDVPIARSSTSPWLVPRTLLNLFIAGLMLRLLLIGYWPLSTDEGVVWNAAARADGLDALALDSGGAPLWILLTRWWTDTLGDSAAMLRMPAAILGLVTLWLAWLLGLRLFTREHAPRRGGFHGGAEAGIGRRRAVWFAGLTAVFVAFLDASQEAGPLAALVAASFGLSLLYLRWLDRNDRLSLGLYALVATVSLYAHGACIWVVAAHVAHVLWITRVADRDETALRARPFLVAVTASLVLFLPLLLRMATAQATGPMSDLMTSFWLLTAGPGLGPAESGWVAVGLTMLVWSALIATGVFALRTRPGVQAFVLMGLLVPVAFSLPTGLLVPGLAEPRLLLLAPWLLLLAVAGALGAPRGSRTVLLSALVLVTAAAAVAFTTSSRELVATGKAKQLDDRTVHLRRVPDPQAPLAQLGRGHAHDRAPWSDVHEFVRSFSDRSSVVLLGPDRAVGAWKHAGEAGREREEPLVALRLSRLGLGGARTPDLDALERRIGDAQRVFLVEIERASDVHGASLEAALDVLVRTWGETGRGLSVLGPVRFGAARVVRVTVFTRS